MRFRTGLVVGGVIGYLVARELTKEDPDDDRPPGVRAAMARHPSNRIAVHGPVSYTHLTLPTTSRV